jgi:hypothetical protein
LRSLKINLAVEGIAVVILKDCFADPKARVPDRRMMADKRAMISALVISVFFVISFFTVEEKDI